MMMIDRCVADCLPSMTRKSVHRIQGLPHCHNGRAHPFYEAATSGGYLQAKISEMPSLFAIPFAVCTAVKNESSLMVFDC
jgi:hypothetical protein